MVDRAVPQMIDLIVEENVKGLEVGAKVILIESDIKLLGVI